MEQCGFDSGECFIRVHVSEEHSGVLEAANKAAMDALETIGLQEPVGTGPLLDLSTLPESAKVYVIDGLHRVSALQQLLDQHPDRLKRYGHVNAVFYTHKILPQVLILSEAANVRSANHVATDNLAKITYYRGLLENYEAETGTVITNLQNKPKIPPIGIWVFKHLGKVSKLNEGDTPRKQGQNVKGFEYCKQYIDMVFYCPRELIEWFTEILNKAEEAGEDVSDTMICTLYHHELIISCCTSCSYIT